MQHGYDVCIFIHFLLLNFTHAGSRPDFYIYHVRYVFGSSETDIFPPETARGKNPVQGKSRTVLVIGSDIPGNRARGNNYDTAAMFCYDYLAFIAQFVTETFRQSYWLASHCSSKYIVMPSSRLLHYTRVVNLTQALVEGWSISQSAWMQIRRSAPGLHLSWLRLDGYFRLSETVTQVLINARGYLISWLSGLGSPVDESRTDWYWQAS